VAEMRNYTNILALSSSKPWPWRCLLGCDTALSGRREPIFRGNCRSRLGNTMKMKTTDTS